MAALIGMVLCDAVLLGTWVTIAGVAYEPEIVAGLVVWRTLTILGPLALGLLTFAVWRRRYSTGVSLREIRAGAAGSSKDTVGNGAAAAP